MNKLAGWLWDDMNPVSRDGLQYRTVKRRNS